MAKRNRQIADDFEAYRSHMAAPKLVDVEFIVSDRKGNHPESFAGSMPVIGEVPYGETVTKCEIRELSRYNYSFSYLSDRNSDRTLARLDVGDGTHNNRVPGIPLELTSVPTPHFHEYREDGHLIAYPIDGIDYSSEESVKFDFYSGYAYLCDRLLMHAESEHAPLFIFAPDGILPFTNDETDPNRGCVFNIDE